MHKRDDEYFAVVCECNKADSGVILNSPHWIQIDLHSLRGTSPLHTGPECSSLLDGAAHLSLSIAICPSICVPNKLSTEIIKPPSKGDI